MKVNYSWSLTGRTILVLSSDLGIWCEYKSLFIGSLRNLRCVLVAFKNPCTIYLCFPHLTYDFASKAFSLQARNKRTNKQNSRANDQTIGTGVNISLFYCRARFWHMLVFKLSSFKNFILVFVFCHLLGMVKM